MDSTTDVEIKSSPDPLRNRPLGSAGHDDLDAATPTGDPVEEAGWFDELPEGASEVPGTDLFLE